MPNAENIVALIFEAFDETNAMLPSEQQLEKSENTALFGPMSPLDSLGLITMIVSIEQKVDEKYGASIVLAEDGDLFQPDSPLRSVTALAEYISTQLE